MPKKEIVSNATIGRPTKPIDWEKLDLYLMSGSTCERIAKAFDMSHETLNARIQERYSMSFSSYATIKRSEGDSLLEAKQFAKAIKENNTQMQIWLGKVRLGQKETLNTISVSQDSIIKAIEDSKQPIE